MKSLTKAIKQEMDIDWDALDGKTVRIVSSGDLPFETTYTLNYVGKGRKDLVSSWMERSSTTLLFEMLYEAWYAPNDYIEIIMDEGVPLLSNTDSETIDPESIQVGSVVLLESKRGVRRLAYKDLYSLVFFAKEDGELFYLVDGSLYEDDLYSPSCPYKIISYITPVELTQTLTTETSNEETEGTDNTVHIVSPDSFEAMGQRISGLISHSFGGDNGENLNLTVNHPFKINTEAISEPFKEYFAPALRNFVKKHPTTEAISEATKTLKNTVKPPLNLDAGIIGKNLKDSTIEVRSKLDWGKK